jgi:hypothetical protein
MKLYFEDLSLFELVYEPTPGKNNSPPPVYSGRGLFHVVQLLTRENYRIKNKLTKRHG